MKLKQIFYWLGIKPKPKTYGTQIDSFTLPTYGRIEYANWLHPKMKPLKINEKQIDNLRTFLNEGDTAIDIGAHAGDTALPMALVTGKTGMVLALEPNTYVYTVLAQNAGLNTEITNIVLLNFAAAETDGRTVFKYSDPGFCNGGHLDFVSAPRHAHFFELEVETKNLLKYFEQEYPERLSKLKYIKTDTEGSDFMVIKMLEPLIDKYHPNIKTEIYRHLPHQDRVEYLSYLIQKGYRLHLCESEENFMGPHLTIKEAMQWSHYDIFAVPEQTGN